MKSRFSIVALSLLVLAHTSFAAPYQSKKGYRFSPPPGWKSSGSGYMGTDSFFTAPPVKGFASNLNVMVQSVPAGTTLQEIRRQGDEMLPRVLTGWKRLGHGAATVAGVRGFVTIGTYRMGTPARQLRMYQTVVICSGKMFAFTCTSPAKNYMTYENAVKKAIATVQWVK